jgi:hypothetical protein
VFIGGCILAECCPDRVYCENPLEKSALTGHDNLELCERLLVHCFLQTLTHKCGGRESFPGSACMLQLHLWRFGGWLGFLSIFCLIQLLVPEETSCNLSKSTRGWPAFCTLYKPLQLGLWYNTQVCSCTISAIHNPQWLKKGGLLGKKEHGWFWFSRPTAVCGLG